MLKNLNEPGTAVIVIGVAEMYVKQVFLGYFLYVSLQIQGWLKYMFCEFIKTIHIYVCHMMLSYKLCTIILSELLL